MGLRTLPSERQGDHLEIEHVPAMQERNAEELRGTRQNKAARAGCNNPAMARLFKWVGRRRLQLVRAPLKRQIRGHCQRRPAPSFMPTHQGMIMERFHSC